MKDKKYSVYAMYTPTHARIKIGYTNQDKKFILGDALPKLVNMKDVDYISIIEFDDKDEVLEFEKYNKFRSTTEFKSQYGSSDSKDFFDESIMTDLLKDFSKKRNDDVILEEENNVNNVYKKMSIKSFDIDGVINLDEYGVGVRPGPDDVIITGRSFEEMDETLDFLHSNGIMNKVYFNPITFANKTRESSGKHKAQTLRELKQQGIDVSIHFEDDEIQLNVIKKECPWIIPVHIKTDFIEKENIRR